MHSKGIRNVYTETSDVSGIQNLVFWVLEKFRKMGILRHV